MLMVKAAADKAIADAKAEAIKAVQAEIETLKKEVEESTDAALKEMVQKKLMLPLRK